MAKWTHWLSASVTIDRRCKITAGFVLALNDILEVLIVIVISIGNSILRSHSDVTDLCFFFRQRITLELASLYMVFVGIKLVACLLLKWNEIKAFWFIRGGLRLLCLTRWMSTVGEIVEGPQLQMFWAKSRRWNWEVLLGMILIKIRLDEVDRSPLTIDNELFKHSDDHLFLLRVELLLALVLRNVGRKKLAVQLLKCWL